MATVLSLSRISVLQGSNRFDWRMEDTAPSSGTKGKLLPEFTFAFLLSPLHLYQRRGKNKNFLVHILT